LAASDSTVPLDNQTPGLPPVSVVLVSPRNPLNIGAAARAMSNFGFFDLRLFEAYRPSLEEARSAVGASSVIAQAREFPSLPEAIADATLVVGTHSLGPRVLQHRMLRLEQAAPEIRAHSGPVALLFGSEKHGLGNDHLSYCDFLVHIPTRAEHDSMNLGQAVAVTLYELIRNDAPIARQEHPRATQEKLQLFEEKLLTVLEESGYARTPSTEEKVRRLIRRMDLEPHDVTVWQGMLRQILWKVRGGRAE
jgi:TrmH family RNA methyltransferase